MVIYLLLLLSFQEVNDSTLNQPVPYQNLDYQLTNLDFQATFDQSTGDIYLFNSRDRTLITISEFGDVDTVYTIPQGYEGLDKMDVTHSGESIYFWENGVGTVHRYDVATDNIVREDTSHPHRTMFSHAPFLSKDNYIYAIGGYGYWEMRNFLIRYEPEFGQWEKVPSNNDEIVIRSWRGLLYKVGNSFYYFIDNTESDYQRKTHAYRFDSNSGMWQIEHQLEDVFENFSVMDRFTTRKFSHNTTHMVDGNNRHFGFLSSTGHIENLNLVSIGESTIYQLNLSAVGIHDVRAAFYSERIDRWVILGHEFPMTERMQLKIHLFKFDENHPFITAYKPGSSVIAGSVILMTGGAIGAGLIGLFLYILLRDKSSTISSNSSGTGNSLKKPVQLIKGDDSISVFINDSRFETSEDKAMKELWTIIAERVESGEPTMLVSNIDQRIYSSQSHPSYNSRNRKKLLKIINTTCGFDLISEERSKIDKRYKVLTVRIDKISLNSK